MFVLWKANWGLVLNIHSCYSEMFGEECSPFIAKYLFLDSDFHGVNPSYWTQKAGILTLIWTNTLKKIKQKKHTWAIRGQRLFLNVVSRCGCNILVSDCLKEASPCMVVSCLISEAGDSWALAQSAITTYTSYCKQDTINSPLIVLLTGKTFLGKEKGGRKRPVLKKSHSFNPEHQYLLILEWDCDSSLKLCTSLVMLKRS